MERIDLFFILLCSILYSVLISSHLFCSHVISCNIYLQHADESLQQANHLHHLNEQHHQRITSLESLLATATAVAKEKDVRLEALRSYKSQAKTAALEMEMRLEALRSYKAQAKVDLIRLGQLVEQGAAQAALEKEERENEAMLLASVRSEVTYLTEENRRLVEECETSQLRIATLMEVSVLCVYVCVLGFFIGMLV